MKIEDAQARCLEIENEIEERRLDLATAQMAARAAVEVSDVTGTAKARTKVAALTEILVELEKRQQAAHSAVERARSEAIEAKNHLSYLEQQIEASRMRARQIEVELPDAEHRVALLRQARDRAVTTAAALEQELAAIKSGEVVYA